MDRRQRFPATSGLSISTAPLVSPTTMYSGPPPPYSYPSSTVSSAPPGSGYISPPESRRTTEDEKEGPASQRQSLPSIQEALSGDKPISYSNSSSLNSNPSATSRPPYLTPAASTSRSFPEGPSGPSNPFSHPLPPTPSQHETPYIQPTSHPLPVRSESEASRAPFPPLSSGDPRPPTLNTFPFSKSPHLNTGSVPHSLPQAHSSLGSDIGPGPSSSPRPGAPTYPNQFPYQPHPSSATSSAYGPPSWEYDERRKGFSRSGPEPPYSDSVKRHLDIYESEMALSDVRVFASSALLLSITYWQQISEGSTRTLDFAQRFAQRAHDSQRSGLPLESLPSVQEVDDILRQSARVTEALSRIRDIIITQQHALAEQQARAFKGEPFDDDLNGFHDDFKGGGFSGGDAKKRRGVCPSTI